jgi:hypothetical protein
LIENLHKYKNIEHIGEMNTFLGDISLLTRFGGKRPPRPDVVFVVWKNDIVELKSLNIMLSLCKCTIGKGFL